MAAPAPQFKKKIRPGLIELDPNEPVIIVNYTSTTYDLTQLDEDGQPTIVESVQEQKRLRCSSFKITSPIPKFAAKIQESCNLIQESKIPRIEELLNELRERLIAQEGGGGGDDLSATAPAPLQMARGATQPSNPRDASSSNGHRGGQSSEFDLRASAPAGSIRPSSHQRRDPDQDEEEDQQPQDERRPPMARPGSASRNRSNPNATVPQPTRSQSPTFNQQQPASSKSNNSSSQSQSQSSQRASNPQSQSQNRPGRSPPAPAPPPPMTEAEIEAYEAAEELRRQKEERALKEQRKMMNMRRAEMATQQAIKMEEQRIELLQKREYKKKKEASKVKKEVASLKRIDEYQDLLYEEDLAKKIRGTSMILQLVQTRDNLDYFIDHDLALGALARVLAEERKKSVELSTNILEIFFCFSSFRQLHPILIQNKIGDNTMKILALEIDRYEMRREKEETKRQERVRAMGGDPLKDNPTNNPLGDITTHYIPANARLSEEEKERTKKLTTFLDGQEKLLFVCFYILLNLAEDISIELKMKNRRIIKYLVKMLHRTGAPFIEDRMFLDVLHILIITFLKKLSIFEENKKEMKEYGIIQAIAILLTNHTASAGGPGCENPEILIEVMKLLFNLSFDPDMKKEIALSTCASLTGVGGGWLQPKNFGKPNQVMATQIQSPSSSSSNGNQASNTTGLVIFEGNQFHLDKELNQTNIIVKCVEYLKKPNVNVRLIAARVLYNLTSDLTYRPLVERALYPDISILNHLILRCSSKLVDRELIALAINITWNPELVAEMITPDGFYSLIKRVHQTFDPLLIKLLRNMSQLPEVIPMFKKFLHELVGMTLKAPSHEFLVESIGILANITLSDVLYSELMAQHGLLDFVVTHLQPGFAEDDIVLECIQLLGTLAIDPKAAPMLANIHLIRNLFELLNEKIEDLDMVVHIVFTIFKFLLHKESREAIMMHQHLTNCLLDLVVDPSPEVRHLANMCLDIIMEHDDIWRDKIRAKRFEAFNREWLQLVAADVNDGPFHSDDQSHLSHLDDPRHMLGPGVGYDHELGLHTGAVMDDSMDDSLGGSGGLGMGGHGHSGSVDRYGYGGPSSHSHLGELGESGVDRLDMEHYRHHSSGEGDDLDESDEM